MSPNIRYIRGHPRVTATGLLQRRPAADVGDEGIRLLRPPGSGIVIVQRVLRADDGIDDRPSGLDDILPREQRCVAGHRVAEQALVVAHSWPIVRPLLALVDDRELDWPAGHPFARALRARADRDHDLRAEAKTNVVAGWRRQLVEHHRR